jgi:hypothetical protein
LAIIGPLPPSFDHRGELDIRALAGRGANACAEVGDGRDGGKLVARAGALVDGVDDLVDEAVDADESFFRAYGGGVCFEFLKSECFVIHECCFL